MSTNTILKSLEFIYTLDTIPKPQTIEEGFEWIKCAKLFELTEMCSSVELTMSMFIESTTVFQVSFIISVFRKLQKSNAKQNKKQKQKQNKNKTNRNTNKTKL